MYDLSRFHKAQAENYPLALAEIKNGRKTSHWIWYIFPQIQGLGRSVPAQLYALASLDEANAYLEDTVLNANLREITQALLSHKDKSLQSIVGDIDAIKIRSSMTLFLHATEDNALFQEVLDVFCAGKEDINTLNILGL